ncbi:MAG: adenosylcobinamide-GDP ribazoletransferase [Lachnospiraceae bacterium]|nr:adenosylcobinamide-GDP ribazoletransferase [Lachnospiraceae bacterium]
MNIFKSFCIAISMYSRIPVPNFEWKEKDMKHAIVFFPLIGLLIGAAEYAVYYYFKEWDLPAMAATVIMCVIPIIITGGIHLDGFMDSSDAINCFGDKEKRLQVLKDPHVGSFAIIRLITFVGLFLAAVYMILYYSFEGGLISYSVDVFQEYNVIGMPETPVAPYNIEELIMVWCLCFTLARVMSAFSAVVLPSANKEGTLFRFSGRYSEKVLELENNNDKSGINKVSLVILIVEEIAVIAAMLCINPAAGGVLTGTTVLVFMYYWMRSKKLFGGVNGDLAGWFLCLAELWMTILTAFMSVMA